MVRKCILEEDFGLKLESTGTETKTCLKSSGHPRVFGPLFGVAAWFVMASRNQPLQEATPVPKVVETKVTTVDRANGGRTGFR